MTTKSIHKPRWAIALGIPFFLFLCCFLITLTTKFKDHPALFSNAILIDIFVVAPFIYFLAIRKSAVSKWTVLRVFVSGLVVAGLILKSPSNIFLNLLETWIYPLLEGGLIFFVGRKFYIANKNAKKANATAPDFLTHCRVVMSEVFGNAKFGNIISSEISVMYYAFFIRRNKIIDYEQRFSSYKENGIVIVLWVILFIFLIETSGVHFLVRIWNHTLAWVLTGLSLYTCIQLFGHIRAIKARPITINKDSLEIHNGLAGDAIIQLDNIDKFVLSKKVPEGRNPIKIALLKNFENHNVVVYLKSPIRVTMIFGMQKNADAVLFYVDKSKDFQKILQSKLHEASIKF
ncbi:MAG: hypothetical protein ABI266_09275 [Ginsengibacter sp.]